MNLTVCCTPGLCSLSLRERAGVRGLLAWTENPLTLTLSQGEREQKVPVKINLTAYYCASKTTSRSRMTVLNRVASPMTFPMTLTALAGMILPGWLTGV